MRRLKEKTTELMMVEELYHETSRMTERLAVLRIATEHINLWIRQLEMKRMEVSELAWLMRLEETQNEIEMRSLLRGGKEDALTNSPIK